MDMQTQSVVVNLIAVSLASLLARGRMDKLFEQAKAQIGKTKQRRCRSCRRVTVHTFCHDAHADAADEFYWRCDVCGRCVGRPPLQIKLRHYQSVR
jgi:hypothetical protein